MFGLAVDSLTLLFSFQEFIKHGSEDRTHGPMTIDTFSDANIPEQRYPDYDRDMYLKQKARTLIDWCSSTRLDFASRIQAKLALPVRSGLGCYT